MKDKGLSHIDTSGNPQMVDVSLKAVTQRTARAQATIKVSNEILTQINNSDLVTKKGSVFQTAILAGVMGAKRTADLIPLCHPLGLENCQVSIQVKNNKIVIDTLATITGKTGVEMEALTSASIAALTIYDMCKAISNDIIIEEIKLMEKTGGKKDFKRN
jgi:cyclic pyranopterin phosphate synthase